VHGLWHLDFHHCSRRVADAKGVWHTPKALCVLDDRSRLCCQNGKQESFRGQLEGRLIAMLRNIDPLSLEFLNRASQAWAELEYNRSIHSEIATSPLDRLVRDKAVGRPCPDTRELRLAFCVEESRSQRRSDGTVAIKGVRFEVPARMRHLERLLILYQTWDLSVAYLVAAGRLITEIYPQDKAQNARGARRTITPDAPLPSTPRQTDPIPPLLRRLLADYAATGLPPAYIPKDEKDKSDDL
jgi:hypothetical protein